MQGSYQPLIHVLPCPAPSDLAYICLICVLKAEEISHCRTFCDNGRAHLTAPLTVVVLIGRWAFLGCAIVSLIVMYECALFNVGPRW